MLPSNPPALDDEARLRLGRGRVHARRIPLALLPCPLSAGKIGTRRHLSPAKELSMPLYSFEGKSPRVHPSAFIAPTAAIIGDVTIEEDASVWYNAVVRADFSPIVIRRGANIQDCAVLHVTPIHGVEVGPGATVAHLCLIHGANIGEEALVGNSSTVLDGARIGVRAMIAAGALVTPGTQIPDGMLAMGAPCKVRGPLEGTPAARWVELNPTGYQALAQRHRVGVKPV
jgi:carbonic anhydrase/acetyltransferase-like protein (isoleucine patch superfamily)